MEGALVAGTGASDMVYDLVSIQYHALKGAQVYDQFLSDASDNKDVTKFIEQVKEQDKQRAQQCHELLAKLTKDGINKAA
jgi:putative heme degradation protein